MSLKLYFWNERDNFGDLISKDVLEYVTKKSVSRVGKTEHSKIVAVGSILDAALPGDLVWGAGVHPLAYTEPVFDGFLRRLRDGRRINLLAKIVAVRGCITNDYLKTYGSPGCEVFGDPAIIAPLIYPKSLNPIRKCLYIKHFTDKTNVSSNDQVKVITPENNWRTIVGEICASEVVVSSSLHGLVLAETYGVPAIFLRTANEGILKYVDYYSATNRFPLIAHQFDGKNLPTKYLYPPSFEDMRMKLIEALPNDLSKYEI